MEEWKEYKLGEVVNILDHKRVPLSSKERSSRQGRYPYYGAQGIIDFIDDYIFDGTYLLIAEDGENLKSQKQNVAQLATGKYWVNNHAHIVESNEKSDIRYICYLLNTLDLSGYITGSAQPKLNQANLVKININLPSLETQKRISDCISSLDDKIECNRRINDNLEQQAQALFKSWFVDFEPFRDKPFVNSELGMIPEGWRVKDIYEYIKVIYGAPYKSTLFNENKNGLPLIRIRDLKTNTPQVYTPEVLPTTEYIESGDIVAGMDAEFIPYIWLGERGVLNQRCCKFKGKNNVMSNFFILYLIKPQLEYVQSYKTGTTVSHLGKSDIDRFKFVTPPLDIIENYSNIVNPMIEMMVNNARESHNLVQLRDTLLPRLMSGKLEIQDIEESL